MHLIFVTSGILGQQWKTLRNYGKNNWSVCNGLLWQWSIIGNCYTRWVVVKT